MKSPARTNGLYGPSGLLMRRNLAASAAGGRRGARPPRRRRRTRRRCRSPAGRSSGSISTVIGGMSTGPQDAERADRQVERRARRRRPRAPPTAPTRAPCGRRRCRSCAARPRRAARRSARGRGRRRRRRSRSRSPPCGDVIVSGPAPQRRQQHRRLGPAGATQRPTDVGGPATSTSSTTSPGATGGDGRGDARRARDAHDAGAVGPRPGRERRALRPVAHDVLPRRTATRTGAAVLVGEAAGDGADLGRHLAAERPAVGERRRRLAARRAPRRVRLEVARLDPRRLQRAGPVPGRHLDRPRSGAVERRPWHAPASRRASPSVSADEPLAVGADARRPARQPARCRRRTRRRRAATCGPTCWGAPPSSRARSAASVLSFGTGPIGAAIERQHGVDDRLPAGAAAQVGGERPADGGRRDGRLVERGDAHDDARACRSRTARRRWRRTPPAQRSASAGRRAS